MDRGIIFFKFHFSNFNVKISLLLLLVHLAQRLPRNSRNLSYDVFSARNTTYSEQRLKIVVNDNFEN